MNDTIMHGPVHARTDDITKEEWHDLLRRFRDASLYQTWSYGSVHWSPRQISHFVLQKSGFPIAAAQFRIVRLPLSPFGVAYLRWGPLCRTKENEPDEELLRSVLGGIRREYGERRGLLVRLIPHVFDNESHAALFRESLLAEQFTASLGAHRYRTVRLNLEPSLEELRKGLDQKWRNQLNRAERNGLEVEEGNSEGLYAMFLELYEEMVARKQFDTSVDPHEFLRIQKGLPDVEKMRILVCRAEGRPVSALVAAAHGDSGIYLLGATNTEGMKWKGAYLLQWRMIEWLKQNGRRWYDLGGINPDTNPGVCHFKKGLSGEDTHEIGQYEYAPSSMARATVRLAERTQTWLRTLRSQRTAKSG